MRLTDKELKEKFSFYPIWAGNSGWIANVATDKLGQLEDIEEELGIDLITLFMVLKQGHIWVKSKDKILTSCDYDFGLTGTAYDLYCKDISEWLLVKDYGKTWALTKEELK